MPNADETPEKVDATHSGSSTVLVVDDEPSICWAFERLLGDQGHRVLVASSAEEGLALAQQNAVDLVLLDVRLPKEDGITALPKFRSISGGKPVIIMTAFGDLDTAVSAVKNGAMDYLVKPFRLDDAKRVCQAALSSQPSTTDHVASTLRSVSNTELIGHSPAMQTAFRQIALVASSDLSVLITGETGTGKELVAAAIHRYSARAEQPYLPIAPVALNEDLIESELFGHVKGAFSGADTDRPGLFEQAEGGTVLLDEIGDLPMNIQVKLLRVLEQGEYCRVGEMVPRKCDVRIIAATNSDLQDAMKQRRFREDLFYRLSGLQIHLPPLRDRLQDIGPLCHHFLKLSGDPHPQQAISDDVVESLKHRPWNGNVRELRNAVGHAAVVARGRALTIDDFPPPIEGSSAADPSPVESLCNAVNRWAKCQLESSHVESLHAEFLAAAEPILFEVVLQKTGGNKAQAAQILGIHRGTLRDKLRQHSGDNNELTQP